MYSLWKKNVGELGLYSSFAYDAVLSIALALNRSAKILAYRNKTLDEFNYTNSELAQVLKESLSNVTFQGFTVSSFLCLPKKISETCPIKDINNAFYKNSDFG